MVRSEHEDQRNEDEVLKDKDQDVQHKDTKFTDTNSTKRQDKQDKIQCEMEMTNKKMEDLEDLVRDQNRKQKKFNRKQQKIIYQFILRTEERMKAVTWRHEQQEQKKTRDRTMEKSLPKWGDATDLAESHLTLHELSGYLKFLQQLDERPGKIQREHKQHEPFITNTKTIQTDQVQAQHKSQQTKDYSDTKKTKIITPKGGTIEVQGYKVFYPPNSLKEEKYITLSIDNNPYNFPKKGLPVTSILNIKPSMKLKVPATVTMPTSCRAAKGEATIQIWSKETGQDWKESQTVQLKNKNEISFKTDHFCGRVGTSTDVEKENLEFIVKNRLFIKKITGEIASIFWLDDKSMQDQVKECTNQGYKSFNPTDPVINGRVGARFKVKASRLSPDTIMEYHSANAEDPPMFEITPNFVTSRTPSSIRFLTSADGIPDSVKRLRIKYSLETKNSEVYDIDWPVKEQDSSSSNPNVQVNVTSETSQYRADSNGHINATSIGSNTAIAGSSSIPPPPMNDRNETTLASWDQYKPLLILVLIQSFIYFAQKK